MKKGRERGRKKGKQGQANSHLQVNESRLIVTMILVLLYGAALGLQHVV